MLEGWLQFQDMKKGIELLGNAQEGTLHDV